MSILGWLALLPYSKFFLLVIAATILVIVLLVLIVLPEEATRRFIRSIKATRMKQQHIKRPRCRSKSRKGGWS